MGQRTEPREVFQCFGGYPIPCAADFPETVKAVLNTGTTEIDGRSLHLYGGAVDAAVRVVETSLARVLSHVTQYPGSLASSGAPSSHTPGRT
jgi:hypothetical protein